MKDKAIVQHRMITQLITSLKIWFLGTMHEPQGEQPDTSPFRQLALFMGLREENKKPETSCELVPCSGCKKDNQTPGPPSAWVERQEEISTLSNQLIQRETG